MSDPILSLLNDRLDSYIKDLKFLVSIDSGSFDKAGVDAVNDWLEDRLTRTGFLTERHSQKELGDNILGVIKGKGRGKILLIGHADTVFPLGTAQERPMKIEGDKILGPGTCDMKAGLLAGVYAIEALNQRDFNNYESITYLCVSDEEIGGARQSKPLLQSEARKADVALTLEAARENGDIVSARKGLCWYTLEAFGKSAHAGVEPEKGRNAIVALAQQVIALNVLNKFKKGMTVNPGVIEGGMAPNIIPDYAKVRIDLRVAAKDDIGEFEEEFRKFLTRSIIPDVEYKFQAEKNSFCPPMERTNQVKHLEKLAQKAAEELGFTVKGASTGGVSDASLVAAEGIPVLDGLGPIGGLDHSPNEYIEMSSIVPRTALLAKLIMAISNDIKE